MHCPEAVAEPGGPSFRKDEMREPVLRNVSQTLGHGVVKDRPFDPCQVDVPVNGIADDARTGKFGHGAF
jgi:hypothetical protein